MTMGKENYICFLKEENNRFKKIFYDPWKSRLLHFEGFQKWTVKVVKKLFGDYVVG